nr:MAG TPA: hypothetical protein [Caudoviricetes sp.]
MRYSLSPLLYLLLSLRWSLPLWRAILQVLSSYFFALFSISFVVSAFIFALVSTSVACNTPSALIALCKFSLACSICSALWSPSSRSP